MAVLVWKHGKTIAEAIAAIQGALKESGYDGSVTWSGSKAEARYGPFASLLHAVGEVTDEAVVLEKCGGLVGGIVLGRCRELLGRLFPGEEPMQQVNAGVLPPGQPKSTGADRLPAGCWIALVTFGLLLVASLIPWYLQSPPLAVARQYVSEQQGIAPDDLELVGHHSHFGRAPVLGDMTVEFRVKGAEQSKKRVVELFRPVYFLPWQVSGLREEKAK